MLAASWTTDKGFRTMVLNPLSFIRRFNNCCFLVGRSIRFYTPLCQMAFGETSCLERHSGKIALDNGSLGFVPFCAELLLKIVV